MRENNNSHFPLAAFLALGACCAFPLLAGVLAGLLQSREMGYAISVVLGVLAVLLVVYLFRKSRSTNQR